MHTGREGVVRGLGFIYIIIWRQHFFPFSDLSPGKLLGAIGNDLVYIHIALRSASGLPDNKWKLVIMLSFEDFITDFCDKIPFIH